MNTNDFCENGRVLFYKHYHIWMIKRAACRESVLQQSALTESFEVPVNNDSGKLLSKVDLPTLINIQILLTNQRERSDARTIGAEIAL